MCGRETFEMLVSSSSMNVAIVTTSAIAHGLCAGLSEGAWSGAAATCAFVRLAPNAAIPWVPPTFRDAADAQGPARGRTRFAPAGAARLLRSCRLRFRRAEG